MKIGVTGGIGSGKSTFCRFLKECGAFVIDADTLAKELMITHPEIREKLISTFGEASYLPDGSLNRAFIAAEAFQKGRVEELNAIVHPVLFRESDKMMEEAEKAGVALVVKEAALLLKYGKPSNLDKVIVVTAPKNNRLERVQKRDNATPELILDRMNAQQPESELVALADIVIHNEGNVDELKQKAVEMAKFFKRTNAASPN
jgi:dephospho-CoA kinase